MANGSCRTPCTPWHCLDHRALHGPRRNTDPDALRPAFHGNRCRSGRHARCCHGGTDLTSVGIHFRHSAIDKDINEGRGKPGFNTAVRISHVDRASTIDGEAQWFKDGRKGGRQGRRISLPAPAVSASTRRWKEPAATVLEPAVVVGAARLGVGKRPRLAPGRLTTQRTTRCRTRLSRHGRAQRVWVGSDVAPTRVGVVVNGGGIARRRRGRWGGRWDQFTAPYVTPRWDAARYQPASAALEPADVVGAARLRVTVRKAQAAGRLTAHGAANRRARNAKHTAVERRAADGVACRVRVVLNRHVGATGASTARPCDRHRHPAVRLPTQDVDGRGWDSGVGERNVELDAYVNVHARAIPQPVEQRRVGTRLPRAERRPGCITTVTMQQPHVWVGVKRQGLGLCGEGHGPWEGLRTRPRVSLHIDPTKLSPVIKLIVETLLADKRSSVHHPRVSGSECPTGSIKFTAHPYSVAFGEPHKGLCPVGQRKGIGRIDTVAVGVCVVGGPKHRLE
eukprot:m.10567 g.10567  ORF g.10567 m.10567 type:complete len:508 (+) comp2758_c0_seq1:159-1682(+)